MKKLFLCILCIATLSLSGQTVKDIGGTVYDDTGNLLPGATIVEKGNTTNGVTSDFHGEFIITVSVEAKELVVSY